MGSKQFSCETSVPDQHATVNDSSLVPLPPNYYDRANDEKITTLHPFPNYYFYNSLTSRGRICSSDGIEYTLSADIHRSKDSTISVYTKNSSCVGSLSFAATHNNFQIHSSGTEGNGVPAELLQVRARIGHPHPTSYSFTLPASCSEPARKVIWTRFGDDKQKSSSSFGYRLTEEVYNTPIATFTQVQGKKYQAVLKRHTPPSDENEEMIVLLSFIGAMTRLTLKGRETMEDWPSGKKRWNAFWYSTILGTAGMAG